MRYVPVLLVLLIYGNQSVAQAISTENALRVSTKQAIKVVVDDLSEEAAKLGLDGERIQKRCELRLGQAGIKLDNDVVEPYLYVNTGVVGPVFNVQVCLFRAAGIVVEEDRYVVAAITWTLSSYGTHGKKSEYILRSLDQVLDTFLNDFQKQNPAY